MAKRTVAVEPRNAAPDRRAGAPRKRTPRKSAALRPDASPSAGPSADELRRQISETAYYKAQQRGFAPGYEHEDWVQAEAEVKRRLGIAGG